MGGGEQLRLNDDSPSQITRFPGIWSRSSVDRGPDKRERGVDESEILHSVCVLVTSFRAGRLPLKFTGCYGLAVGENLILPRNVYTAPR